MWRRIETEQKVSPAGSIAMAKVLQFFQITSPLFIATFVQKQPMGMFCKISIFYSCQKFKSDIMPRS